MSDMQGSGNTGERRGLVEVAEELRPNLARVGTALVGIPFLLLPQKNRDEAMEATNNLFNTVGDIHLSLTKSVVDGVGSAVRSVVNNAGSSGSRTPTKVTVDTDNAL
jgi:hypothetical protein